jgi:hypothetical protein
MTLIVLVTLREGVAPEEYERFIRERYAPVARSLPSVSAWDGYRVSGLLASGDPPPCRYVVVVEVTDPAAFGRDVADEPMRTLLAELHPYAELTQLVGERFA